MSIIDKIKAILKPETSLTKPKQTITPQPKEPAPSEPEEYEIVEKEILPEKIICPDCGGITLAGLDFCDKCGGELTNRDN
jgi:hypothetical protein